MASARSMRTDGSVALGHASCPRPTVAGWSDLMVARSRSWRVRRSPFRFPPCVCRKTCPRGVLWIIVDVGVGAVWWRAGASKRSALGRRRVCTAVCERWSRRHWRDLVECAVSTGEVIGRSSRNGRPGRHAALVHDDVAGGRARHASRILVILCWRPRRRRCLERVPLFARLAHGVRCSPPLSTSTWQSVHSAWP